MTKIPALIKNFCDALWEYDSRTNQVYIYHDNMTPELCGRRIEYDYLYDLYRKNHVYQADANIWENILAPDRLAMFLKGGESSLHFSIRLRSREGEMQWHEAFIERLDESRLLLSSRDIQNIQRNASIAQAVIPEFDYVCYIDIKMNSYILYSSGDKKTIIPENVFDDYG